MRGRPVRIVRGLVLETGRCGVYLRAAARRDRAVERCGDEGIGERDLRTGGEEVGMLGSSTAAAVLAGRREAGFLPVARTATVLGAKVRAQHDAVCLRAVD